MNNYSITDPFILATLQSFVGYEFFGHELTWMEVHEIIDKLEENPINVRIRKYGCDIIYTTSGKRIGQGTVTPECDKISAVVEALVLGITVYKKRIEPLVFEMKKVK